MQQRIAVANLQRLADAHAEHARRVAALVLIEHDRLGRNRKAEAAEPILHVDEHVLQRLVVADDDLLVRRAAAPPFSLTHFGSPVMRDHFRRRHRALEFHRCGDGSGGCGIDRRSRAARRCGGAELPPHASENASKPDRSGKTERTHDSIMSCRGRALPMRGGGQIESEVRKSRVPLSSRGQDARFSVWTPGFESP